MATAADENISITDHNDTSNVKLAIDIGQRSGFLVVPGVELLTAQGHLVCYLPRLRSTGEVLCQLGQLQGDEIAIGEDCNGSR